MKHLRIFLLALSLCASVAKAQTPIVYTNLTMIGTTQDTSLTVKAVSVPAAMNGTFYTMPATGLAFKSTNGVGAFNLLPGKYTGAFSGIPQSFTFVVTNSPHTLNLPDLIPLGGITIYSGVQSLTGAGGISIIPPTGAGGNYTVSNNPLVAASNIVNGPIPTGVLTAGVTNDPGHLLAINAGDGLRHTTFNANQLTNLAGAPAVGHTNILLERPDGTTWTNDVTNFEPAGTAATNIVFSGNTWWVDPIFGNDLTGTNQASRPFSHLHTAVTNASAAFIATGNRQRVMVAPGFFYDNDLGRNGVDWQFSPGCTISNFCNDTVTNSWLSIFSDLSGPCTYTVLGNPNLIFHDGTNYVNVGTGANIHPSPSVGYTSTNAMPAILITNALSRIIINMGDGTEYALGGNGGGSGTPLTNTMSGDLGGGTFILVQNCAYCEINGGSLNDGNLGTLTTFTNAGNGNVTAYPSYAGAVWWNIGETHVKFKTINSFGGVGIWCEYPTTNSIIKANFYLDVDTCKCNIYTDSYLLGTSPIDYTSGYREWFTFRYYEETYFAGTKTNKTGTGYNNAGAANEGILLVGGFPYITAQKVVSAETDAISISGYAGISNPKLTLDIGKIQCLDTNGASYALHTAPQGGTPIINGYVGDFDLQTVGNAGAINNAGGSIYLTGNTIIVSNSLASAPIVNSGTMQLTGYKIDSSGISQNPFNTLNGVTLQSCTLNPFQGVWPPTFATLGLPNTNYCWSAQSNSVPPHPWFGHFDAASNVVFDGHMP